MYTLKDRALTFVAVLFLTACADSATRSVVSTTDLPAGKYKRIAVFVEDRDPAAPSPGFGVNVAGGGVTLIIPEVRSSATYAEIEQKIVSSLKSASVNATSGPDLFKGRNLNSQAKASLVQKDFDAVLYVAVLTNGMREQRVEGAFHNGQYITVGGETRPIDIYDQNRYELKSDGSVWRRVPTFEAKCDLQDTKTNKVVWSSETTASGGTLVLLSRASEQIVEKLRSDGAI